MVIIRKIALGAVGLPVVVFVLTLFCAALVIEVIDQTLAPRERPLK